MLDGYHLLTEAVILKVMESFLNYQPSQLQYDVSSCSKMGVLECSTCH